ncbi:MAG: hypothetical protein WCU88_12160 [Elusimicrobiota bacterium]|jgi:hypothetical protein
MFRAAIVFLTILSVCPAFAQSSDGPEAHLARLTEQIAAVRTRDRAYMDAELQKSWLGSGGLGDLKVSLSDVSYHALENRLTQAWNLDPSNTQWLSIVHARAGLLEKARRDLGGKTDPASRAALLQAEIDYKQAELGYAVARQAFDQAYFAGFISDFLNEMGDSLIQVSDAVVDKVIDNMIEGAAKFRDVKDLETFKKAAMEFGSGLVEGVTAELFKSGLKEYWVKSLTTDTHVPRYYAVALYKRFIIPDAAAERSLQDKVAMGAAKVLADKLGGLAGERAGLGDALKKVFGSKKGEFIWGKVLNGEDIGKLMDEAAKKGTVDKNLLLQLAAGRAGDAAEEYRKDNKLLPAIDKYIGKWWMIKDANEMLYTLISQMSTSGDAGANSAVNAAVKNYDDLKRWLDAHPTFGIEPAEETSGKLVLDAALDNPGPWQSEANAYEKALGLEASWSEGKQVSVHDIAAAWMEVFSTRGEEKAWPPFRHLAHDRVAYWKNVQEKPGPWARWRRDADYVRNGKAADGYDYDHGDSLLIRVEYRVAGLQPKDSLGVTETVGREDEEGAAKRERIFKNDDIVPVEYKLSIPAGLAPGSYNVVFGLWDGANLDAFNAGFSVSSLYPRRQEQLNAALGALEACQLTAAVKELAELEKDAAVKRSQNGLLGGFYSAVTAAASRAKSAQEAFAQAGEAYRDAQQETLYGCNWGHALRQIAKARSILKKLPAACAADAKGMDVVEADAESLLEDAKAMESYAAAGDNALAACALEEAVDDYAVTVVLFDGLSGASPTAKSCSGPAKLAKAAEAHGRQAEDRLKERDAVAAAVQAAQDAFDKGRNVEAIQKANLALGLVRKSSKDNKACLSEGRGKALQLAVQAGRDLLAPDPGRAAQTLPPDDSLDRTGKVLGARRKHLADQAAQQAAAAAAAADQAAQQSAAAAADQAAQQATTAPQSGAPTAEESGAAFGRALGEALFGAPPADGGRNPAGEPSSTGSAPASYTADSGQPQAGPSELKRQCIDCVNALISGSCYVRIPTMAGWGLSLSCSNDGGVEEGNRHIDQVRCPACAKANWTLCDFKPAPKGCVAQCCSGSGR